MTNPRRIKGASNNRKPTESDIMVGRTIKSLRRNQSLTQRELAHRVGITGAQLHRYENGSTRIATSRLIAIADALKVNAETLIAVGQKQSTETVPPVATKTADQARDDIIELVELYSSMTDPRHRSALMVMARIIKRSEHPMAQTN
ncbi:helix-turn-helix domain-containing protein [Patescibacteria group bacterium]|nr:helix-turn-helix domain-containing protein [Patescibacteria group bacterium]